MSPQSTRDRILEVAARLFHEQGFVATGVSTILREAGVQSGSLYHFFPSKEALLLGVLDWYHRHLHPIVMQPAFVRTDDPIERVFAVLAGYREMLAMTRCNLGCPIGNLALELSDQYPAVREKVCGNFDQWCEAIAQCFEAAGDRLPTDCDRAALARFVLAVMEGGMMQAKAHKSLDKYDASVAHLRQYIDALIDRAKAEQT